MYISVRLLTTMCPDMALHAVHARRAYNQPCAAGAFTRMQYMDGKIEVSESKWIPLSIVKGGQAANLLVKACESEWGRKLYSNTLIRNIGLAVYKVGAASCGNCACAGSVCACIIHCRLVQYDWFSIHRRSVQYVHALFTVNWFSCRAGQVQ
jgi:hypothetical protein